MLLLCLKADAGPAAPEVLPGLEALRAGRFDAAKDFFARLTASEPAAPEGPFFEAFHLWWWLLDRPGDRGARLRMEDHLAEAARRGQELRASPVAEERERGLVLSGAALLLDAQSKAARGAHLSAASLARQGHRALTSALEAAPGAPDALFAMGAYNYYADKLPLLVKGLRFLLRIPGGDERKGIEQLETAGARSALFGTESLMLLAHIFSGGYELDHRRALRYVEEALGRSPDSPVLALARADLLFELGRLRESVGLAASVLVTVGGRKEYPEELERAASYRLAACTLKLHDPLEALERIESALRRSPPQGPGERRRWLALLASSAIEAGQPERLEPWIARLDISERQAASLRKRTRGSGPDPVAAARAQALRSLASGREAEAKSRLEELLERNPRDRRLHYDLGRLLQQQGRLDEARPHLEAVLAGAASGSTADLAGWAMVRLGWELEQKGQRPAAVDLYRRAAELKQFTFQAAARDLLTHPADGQPEG